jgi:hypothetical protein
MSNVLASVHLSFLVQFRQYTTLNLGVLVIYLQFLLSCNLTHAYNSPYVHFGVKFEKLTLISHTW